MRFEYENRVVVDRKRVASVRDARDTIIDHPFGAAENLNESSFDKTIPIEGDNH